MGAAQYILIAVAMTLLIVGVTVPVGYSLLKRALRESRRPDHRGA